MSVISQAQTTTSTTTAKNITYTKANSFLKLLDEEHPASALLQVLKPGKYTIGTGSATLHWDGKIVTHTPPDGEVEVYDYMLEQGRGSGGATGLGRFSGSNLGMDMLGMKGGGEVVSPWARGWDNIRS